MATVTVPETTALSKLREAVQHCRNCDLYKDADRAVFGEGPKKSPLMMVGETPGDQEDKKGHVFVGPAGRLLDEALIDAGIDRAGVYLTNAVKHFKFTREERGKRRLHKTPSRSEIVACQTWLERELAAVKPAVLVLLGAVAASSVMGPSFRVTQQRGEVLDWPDHDGVIVATVHPSAVLRADDREAAYAEFVADLRVAARALP
ncbi:UdgX family uracil-DNA binding protein [Tenggerimyces flavus]|uniref:Type-4 uracil-DNA glycosylase n=1 Tax=Tenggerimyces flavus TaxID=1708749 RepID=A0ABV7Y4M0_9ACTN|nr:UdgX family uracil-DNA binding protein [Tenggerimyces flavus]MBM7788697.1 DNA polymerase [Tenggerimyces flavus]